MKSESIDNVQINVCNQNYVPKEQKKVSVQVHVIDPVREVYQTMGRKMAWANWVFWWKKQFILYTTNVSLTETHNGEHSVQRPRQEVSHGYSYCDDDCHISPVLCGTASRSTWRSANTEISLESKKKGQPVWGCVKHLWACFETEFKHEAGERRPTDVAVLTQCEEVDVPSIAVKYSSKFEINDVVKKVLFSSYLNNLRVKNFFLKHLTLLFFFLLQIKNFTMHMLQITANYVKQYFRFCHGSLDFF